MSNLNNQKNRKVAVTFIDRLDRKFQLRVDSGKPTLPLLSSLHIPLDAVIIEKNGQIVDETSILNFGDSVIIRMVRAYHLFDFLLRELDLRVGEKSKTTSSSLYTKRLLWFNDDGQTELIEKRVSRDKFASFLENTFIESILEKKLIEEGDTIGLALSGGRDSLALLYLLAATRKRLPSFRLKGATICEVSNIRDIEIAKEASCQLEIDQKLIEIGEVKKIFGLKITMEDTLGFILKRYGLAKAINCAHAYVKTCLEIHFAKEGVNKIAFGLHNEDLLASLLRSVVNGIPFGKSIYQKSWGPFTFIYPLWGITKKELTIYLDVVAPKKHCSQKNPATFDRGGHSRDLQYFLADSIQTLWPGFSYHAFEGYKKLFSSVQLESKFNKCRNCQGIFIPNEANQSENICYLCQLLMELKLLNKGRARLLSTSSFDN